MTTSNPKHHDRLEVEAIIRAAGPAGISSTDLAQTTGMTRQQIKRLIGRIMAGKTTFARLPNPNGRSTIIAAKDSTAPSGSGAAVLTAVKGRPRNSTLSPARMAIEAVLHSATEPLDSRTLAERAAVPLEQCRRLLQTMQLDRHAINVSTGYTALWRAPTPQYTPSRAPRPTPVCNSAMPTARPYQLPTMNCPRADADQHLNAPSRRADQLERYRASVLIGSNLGGGM